jgi:hypothetical protein
MIANYKNNSFAKIEFMPDGRVARFGAKNTILEAHASRTIDTIYQSLDYMKGYYWNLLPPDPTCQTLSAGEILTDGEYYVRVLAYLGGYGELATFAISINSMNKDSDDLKRCRGTWTACELVKSGWEPLPPEPSKDAKADECLKYLESVGKVKDGKVVVG